MSYTNSRQYFDQKAIAATSTTGAGEPSAPHSLRLTAVSDSSIDVEWINGSSSQTSVEIQSRDSSGTWSALATLGAAVTTYSNTGLAANTTRAYRVRGVNASGNSAWSNVVIDATTETGSELANTYWWQRVLRSWMGSHVSGDFDVTLSSITDVTGSMTDDEIWNTIMVAANRGNDAPQTRGFRLASSIFVLSNIEASSQVNLKMGRTGGFFEPQATAFYAYWENDLNPYYDNTNIYRRALTGIAVDAIESVNYVEADESARARTDLTGGYISKWALVYWMYQNHPGTAQTIVDDNTHEAFIQSMKHMWAKMKDQYPGGAGGADLESFQLKAAPYLYSLGVIDLNEYKDRVSYVIAEITNPQGGFGFYHDHGGDTEVAIDLAYEGIMYSFMAEAAVAEHFLVPNVSLIKDSLKRSTGLVAHITSVDKGVWDTGIDPGFDLGTLYSPSHFNTGTPGIAETQWPHPERVWEAAYLFDEQRYRIHGYHNEQYFINTKMVRDRNNMINTWGTATYITGMNTSGGAGGNDFVTADATAAPVWAADQWINRLPALVLHRVTDWYADVLAVETAGTDENLILPPVLRTADFIKDYSHLAAIKLGNLHTVIHAGPVRSSWSSQPSQLRGGISSFFIKGVNPFILGVGTGGQDDVPDNWTTHESWAVNTLSGTVSGGQFSEARYLGAPLEISSMDSIGRIINVTDANDLTQLYKKGDIITVEDWAAGSFAVHTLAEDATHSSGVTTLVVSDPLKSTTRGAVYPHGMTSTESSFRHESRSIVDTTKASTSTNSATIDGLVIKRIISGTSEKTTVNVKYTSQGQEAITDMWEQLPLLYGIDHASYAQTADMEYWNGTAWTTLTTTEVSSQYIRLVRDSNEGSGDQYAYVVFNSPQHVRVSAAIIEKGIGGTFGYGSRNLKIRMGDTNIFPRKSLTYHLQETSPV